MWAYGKKVFLGFSAWRDFVIAWIGHYVKLATQPGSLPGDLGEHSSAYCITKKLGATYIL